MECSFTWAGDSNNQRVIINNVWPSLLSTWMAIAYTSHHDANSILKGDGYI